MKAARRKPATGLGGTAPRARRVEVMVVGKKGVIVEPLTLRARTTWCGRPAAGARWRRPLRWPRSWRRWVGKVGYAVRDFGSCGEAGGQLRAALRDRIAQEVIDIVFGDRVTLGGFIEVLVLVLTMILARLGLTWTYRRLGEQGDRDARS